MNQISDKEGNGKRIGLALGSGSARGMAHIGVIQRLHELGVKPDIICGTSAGALIGACYACDKLDHFGRWISGLSNSDILRYMDIRLLASGGVAHGGRLINFFKEHYGDPNIEDLPIAFAAVATNLYRGREVWLQKGSLWDAVRASIAIPGVLIPIADGDSWLVDGGLVNPVPVSVCRALGADVIIAVNLNSDLVGRKRQDIVEEADPAVDAGLVSDNDEADDQEEGGDFSALSRLTNSIRGAASNLWDRGDRERRQPPGALNVMLSSLNIMQDRITRSRLAGEPADLVLSPRLGHIGFMEFNRAADSIIEGRAVVDRMLAEIHYALDMDPPTVAQAVTAPSTSNQISTETQP